MFTINSLQKRLVVFLIVPVALFFLGFGTLGYFYIRHLLFSQWQQTAILQLERAAHTMDMALDGPMRGLQAFGDTGPGAQGAANRQWLLHRLREEPGVKMAVLTWQAPGNAIRRIARVTPPAYFYPPDGGVVGLRADLQDETGRPLGRLEVLLTYDYLMKDLMTSGWMATNQACLLNANGMYLAHSNPAMESRHCLGETRDPLEEAMGRAMQQKPFGTLLAPGLLPDRVVGFYKLHEAPWVIMLHAQGGRILSPIRRFSLYYLVGVALCLAFILGLIRLCLGPLAAAIRKLSGAAARVARGEYGKPLPVQSRDEIGRLTQSFNNMMTGLKERDFISNTFGRYVDPEIARELLRRPEAARLGGEKRQVVILFSDLRDFTPLAEVLSPEDTIHLVNRHFSRMIDIIQEHRGIIVDFLGDAILFFMDPLDGPLAPTVHRGVRCALTMQEAVRQMNVAEIKYPPLQMGVGVHTGEVVVGNVGSESRAKYGIIGSAVNLTHRLQGQAHGGEVVLSEAAYQLTGDSLKIKRTIETRLKGIHDPVTLYVVEGMEGRS